MRVFLCHDVHTRITVLSERYLLEWGSILAFILHGISVRGPRTFLRVALKTIAFIRSRITLLELEGELLPDWVACIILIAN